MRIASVGIEARAWRVAAENAHHRWTEREGRVVVLTDPEGRVGLGEASPLPGYSPDDLVVVDAALVGLAGRLEPSFDAEGDIAAQIADRAATVASPSARFAVEMALWDLFGRIVDEPVAILWGAAPQARVRTAALVDLMSSDRWPFSAPATLKVKVGRPGQWDRERAQLVALGAQYPGTPLRLDANRAWGGDEAVDRLAAIAKLDLPIEFIEEPTFADLADIVWPAEAPPIALDETLRDGAIHSRRVPQGQAAGAQRARALVLKPSVLGGIAAVRALAERAPQAVLSHVFEGPLAHAAAAAVALAVAPTTVAGLGPHPGVDGWPDVEAGHLQGDVVRVPAGPGLGWRGRP